MSTNVCGNCSNFKPKSGESLFNCTDARHGGLAYGMQVRVDTRACDAFRPYERPSVPSAPAGQSRVVPLDDRIEPAGLCEWGKTGLVLSVALAILLVSWLLYTCA